MKTLGILFCCAALGAVLGGCLRPTEERARRDLEIGRAEAADVVIEVQEGLAAVRQVKSGEVSLWAGAPVIRLTLTVGAGAPSEWQLSVRNVLPDTELSAASRSGRPVAVEPSAGELPTEKRFALVLPTSDEVTLVLAPPDANDRGSFTLALLSDVQEAIDRVEDIWTHMNGDPAIRFALGAGDLTEQGTEGELALFQRKLTVLRVPYYTTLGNHELGTSPPPFQDYFGRASFHFVYRGAHFSMLDSGSAMIDPMVYEWLDGWLSQAQHAVHIAAMHIPPIDPIGVRNGSFASRNEAAKLLSRLAEGGVDLTVYGHIHSYYRFDNAGIPAHISGGGGALPERFDDIGRHYVKVEVDPHLGIRGTTVVRVD